MREARLVIDTLALRHNVQRVRDNAPASRLIAMVKADAYGHGALAVAEALPNADAFGVAFLEEALALRAADIRQPIAVLEGLFSREEMEAALQHQLMIVVHQEQQLQLLEQCRSAGKVQVWLKADTGMHRLGFPPEMVPQVFQRLLACSSVESVGLLSHFAAADNPESPQTTQQITCFQDLHRRMQAVSPYKVPTSLCNSAGILAWPAVHGDWVRPGIMLYGSSPFAAESADSLGLRPVMTLSSRLIAVNPLKKGESVGYGATWTAERDTRIGVVAIGYGDGYPRTARNGTPVLVNGHIVPLAGRVSMDMITVDLGDLPVEVGAPCVLWGEGLPVDEVAACAGTLSYELFCKVTARVGRSRIG